MVFFPFVIKRFWGEFCNFIYKNFNKIRFYVDNYITLGFILQVFLKKIAKFVDVFLFLTKWRGVALYHMCILAVVAQGKC